MVPRTPGRPRRAVHAEDRKAFGALAEWLQMVARSTQPPLAGKLLTKREQRELRARMGESQATVDDLDAGQDTPQ